MTRAPGFAHIGLRSVRWLLPWMSALLVSVSLAYATNGAVTGSWQTLDGRPARSRTPGIGELASSGAVQDGDAAPALDVACIARVAAYTASLSDAVRRCSTLAGASATTPPGERGAAQCELIVGQPRYVGQNTWVPQRDWQCADPLP